MQVQPIDLASTGLGDTQPVAAGALRASDTLGCYVDSMDEYDRTPRRPCGAGIDSVALRPRINRPRLVLSDNP
jgi:hypothetical protein